MRYASPPLRQAATRWLAHEVGGERATSEHLAAASARLLDWLSEHLAQIVGRAGIEALWLRAVRLPKLDFPFLGMTTPRDRVPLRRLATGVPGLDDVLDGGLPELSFNLGS